MPRRDRRRRSIPPGARRAAHISRVCRRSPRSGRGTKRQTRVTCWRWRALSQRCWRMALAATSRRRGGDRQALCPAHWASPTLPRFHHLTGTRKMSRSGGRWTGGKGLHSSVQAEAPMTRTMLWLSLLPRVRLRRITHSSNIPLMPFPRARGRAKRRELAMDMRHAGRRHPPTAPGRHPDRRLRSHCRRRPQRHNSHPPQPPLPRAPKGRSTA